MRREDSTASSLAAQESHEHELSAVRADLEAARAELDLARQEMESARAEQDASATSSKEEGSQVLEAAARRAAEAQQEAEALGRALQDARLERRQQQELASQQAEELQARVRLAVKEARALRNQVAELKGAIRVVVRVRPPPRRSGAQAREDVEALRVAPGATATGEGRLLVDTESGGTREGSRKSVRSFDVDSVHGPASTQEECFSEVRDSVASVVQGVDCAVLSYGQTGSGKTYTMLGPEEYSTHLAGEPGAAGGLQPAGDGAGPELAQAGLIPRAVLQLFEAAEEV